MKKIESIVIEKIIDTDPDTSWMGQYSMEAKTKYAIKRNVDSRHMPYFNPPVENYEGESEEDIKKHCQQDYERMEALNNGEWHFIGIKAVAEIRTSENGKEWLINKVSSGGLWGIESDGGDSYFNEVRDEQLYDLGRVLLEFGFSLEEIAEATKIIGTIEL